ncbi:SDR family NAD(P)-dependent oxidoreductase [Nocardia terpenica]|uniref:SDR family NAD(P)-dependent oxidoreductase n=1 Tax=Nocardia terpenica TaxID=455432 RepID=UPI0018955029|nr:SDR family NAD(P)-dependent oxidoreductase [Nocardia terpenica]MBF6065836.1 SDR family NAD(P)-dependent oxidoreductase [Nocardia terpenica]MBF6108401.1 SDR family NAD(P)-dependent oxidoreductase [Nocardia terpenica]MBF6115951.1 SDR family NAD(P)-dependent oxidoreductase [Nocardia terpenica]MBF6123081.1 SDR family NAD(P)-dependent oxidoreductase [Nocardia terpenica]MBF6156245.1 SDR family NAD(P)-dependent oxidoreductase [Nocardia terpenica]
MKTVVITGGTDGMGKALALTYLRRGDRVIILGSNESKGRAVLAAATELGAADRAEFLRADLSLVSENRRILTRIAADHPVIDTLVLAARYFRANRFVTTEGFEATFALFYLSRYLFGHALAPNLDRATTPVILNLAGPGGNLSEINWDDLQFAHHYDPDAIMNRSGKLNDLLAVSFTHRHPTPRARYILLHPGLTATAFTGQYDSATARLVAGMRDRGQPVEAAVTRILHHLDNPPTAPLTAYMQDTPIDTTGTPFSPEAAARLENLTESLLSDR